MDIAELKNPSGHCFTRDNLEVAAEDEDLELADDASLLGGSAAHYQILERIGVGGMGVVYRAMDLRLSRPVALKLLPGHMVRLPRALERFVREARASGFRAECAVDRKW